MPIVATTLLALCAAAGAWLDVVSRRLPNWLCLITALLGLGLALAMGGFDQAWSPAAHGVIALAVCMALFAAGWIGGGDAKFYAACACWFPLQSALSLLFAVSLAGLILVIGWFGYRQITRARRTDEKTPFALVPYGLAVATGTVAARLLMP